MVYCSQISLFTLTNISDWLLELQIVLFYPWCFEIILILKIDKIFAFLGSRQKMFISFFVIIMPAVESIFDKVAILWCS